MIRSSLTEGHVYEFTPEEAGKPIILAVWRATGEGEVLLPSDTGVIEKAERMPLAADVDPIVLEKAQRNIMVGGRPLLLWVTVPAK